jgi:hypothetical protein
MPAAVDLTGKRFGRLVVLDLAAPKGKARAWSCRCDCGAITVSVGRNLSNGHTRSCGCMRIKHGEYAGNSLPTPELAAWKSMLDRCGNPHSTGWSSYGGRGVVVCELWRLSFDAFLADMGRRPSELHSIDRIDVNGNYEPGNCRWATPAEQANNKRNTMRITIGDASLSVPEWSRLTGVHKDTILGRLERGWDPALAVSAEPQRSNKGSRYAFSR